MKTLPRPTLRAFSLIEMLVVISIIGIIASFAIPAATTMVRGTDVNRASQMLADQLSSARQTAITRNHPIEVRILRFADPEQPGEKPEDSNTWKFRGIQLMEVSSSGIPVQLAPVQRLPGAMLMNDGKYSSLLDKDSKDSSSRIKHPTDLDPALPRMAKASERKYEYVAFRFMPDGSTNLNAKGNWYITLHSLMDNTKLNSAGSGGATDAIKTINYFTIQIDPVSGATRSYRPQLG